MRLIAITQRVIRDQITGERRDGLDQRWWDFLAACGLTPLALPNHLATAARVVETLRPAGAILTGGGDLAALGGDTPERDEVEVWLINRAIEGMPLLGVCRGMQAIQHRWGAELGPVAGHVRTEHTVTGSLGERTVNSFHNLGACNVSAPLRVLARADDDGVVEAVGHDTAPILGIMWHPERRETFDPHDVALFVNHFGGAA